jgi:uncharacterized alkaline shock family protein YloU
VAEEQSTTEQSSTTRESGRQVARRGGGASVGALQSERGTTTMADTVVTRVASIAAREVPGVHDLGGGVSRALGSVTGRVGLGTETSRGVGVEVGSKQAAVDLALVIEFGVSVPEVTREVRENVIKRIEGITGLEVTEVNITVNDLFLPGDDDDRSDRVE